MYPRYRRSSALFTDEVPDVHIRSDVELGQDVVVAGNGIDFGGDLPVCEGAGDGISLAQYAFYLNKERFHAALHDVRFVYEIPRLLTSWIVYSNMSDI